MRESDYMEMYLPENTDPVDIEKIDYNFEKIDAAVEELDTKTEKIENATAINLISLPYAAASSSTYAETITYNGLNTTQYSDGRIEVSGTLINAANGIYYRLNGNGTSYGERLPLGLKKYILSLNEVKRDNSDIDVLFQLNFYKDGKSTTAINVEDGYIIDNTQGDSDSVQISIRYNSHGVVNLPMDRTFYPMIEAATKKHNYIVYAGEGDKINEVVVNLHKEIEALKTIILSL